MKTKYIIVAALFIIASLESCSDFLEEYSQDMAYVRSYVDLDELLLGDGYMSPSEATPIGYSYGGKRYYPYIHMMADEIKENIEVTGSSVSWDAREAYFGYYTWQKQVGIDADLISIGEESTDWDQLYYHINIANMVLEEIDNQAASTDDDYNEVRRIKGEAYFLRAAYYFTLVNLYGNPYKPSTASVDLGVPIKITNYVEDKVFYRNTVQEVYEQVLSDLQEAEGFLTDSETKSIYRANIAAVELLSARVYLYMQNWAKAQEYAQKIIDSDYTIDDLNNYVSLDEDAAFLTPDSKEVILSMGVGNIVVSLSDKIKDISVSEDLFNTFGNDDLRKQHYIVAGSGTNYYEYRKVAADWSITNLSDKFLLRASEAYLIKAEACACSGAEGEARSTLNDFRKYRIKQSLYEDIVAGGAELVQVIRDERRRELCLEGHRWFDLRRYMVCEPYPYSKVIRNSYTTFFSGWTSTGYGTYPVQTRIYQLEKNDPAYTLPIPREVLDFNTGMVNNERGEREPVEVINY